MVYNHTAEEFDFFTAELERQYWRNCKEFSADFGWHPLTRSDGYIAFYEHYHELIWKLFERYYCRDDGTPIVEFPRAFTNCDRYRFVGCDHSEAHFMVSHAAELLAFDNGAITHDEYSFRNHGGNPGLARKPYRKRLRGDPE